MYNGADNVYQKSKPMPNLCIPLGYAIDELCLAFNNTLHNWEAWVFLKH